MPTLTTLSPVLWYAAYSAAGLYGLWLFYLALMHLQRAHDAKQLSAAALVLGTPLLVVGFVIDFLVNVLVVSVLFFEPPRELTVTARFKRWIKNRPRSIRGRSACWICTKLLDVFDPSGRHCK